MTRNDALAAAHQAFDEGALASALARRVAFATESEEAHTTARELGRYLDDEITPTLTALGFRTRRVANPLDERLPVLIAQRVEDTRSPTLLMYGHGDVVRGHAASWREGLQPFVMKVEGDRWYGRGTADNKGQHSINLAALEQVLRLREGRLGYNVTLLFEMGEEAGSPGLEEVVELEREALAAQLFLASDGPRVHAQRPTLFLGSRGACNVVLEWQARERAYHSGNWGGALANPAIVLANAVASLVDANGKILVESLRPKALPETVRQALQDIEIGTDDDAPDIDVHWGEPGLSPAERVIGWNSLEVLAMTSGRPSAPVNAIPPSATVHAQLRFVVGTRCADIVPALRAHLDERGFGQVTVKLVGCGEATRLDPASPWVHWALSSMQKSTGKRAALLPNLGGSLPNALFADRLGLPTLWVPHSYPACAQHAPNEHLLASVAREAMGLMAGLFWDLGEANAPWGSEAFK